MSNADSIRWIKAYQQPTANTAFEGWGYCLTSPYFFFMLPNYVAKLPLTPAAKWLFAMLVTESFPKDKPRFEYFKGIRTMAGTLGMSPSLTLGALNELMAAGLVWKSETVADKSKRRRNYYEIGWTGDVDSLEKDHGLKNADKPGPLTYAIKRHLAWYVPIYYTFASFLREFNKICQAFKRTANLDMIVYGYVTAKARPFLFRSLVQIGRDLGMHRKTIKAALDRLESLYMIKHTPDGYYVVAHPFLSTDENQSAELLAVYERVKENDEEKDIKFEEEVSL